MISMVVIYLYGYFGIKGTLVIEGLILALFLYRRWLNNYFPSRGVKSFPITVPILENIFRVFVLRQHVSTMTKKLYEAFPNEK